MSCLAVPTRESAISFVFAPAAFVAPPLAVFAPLALAPLLVIVASALLAIDARQVLANTRGFIGYAALIALITVWAAISALWSPIPGHSLFEAIRLLPIAAAGLVLIAGAASLSAGGAARTGYALIAGLAVSLLVLQIELRTDEAIAHAIARLLPGTVAQMSRYDRGVTVLVTFLWPAVAFFAARRQWFSLALLVVAVGFTVINFQSHASMLALAAAPVLGLTTWRLPRLATAGLIAATFVLAIALPVLTPHGAEIAQIQREAPILKPSAIHRLAIWRFVGDRIANRPLLGWGMDSARAIPGGKTEVDQMFPELHLPATAQALPLHPHNAALQWRLELGIPGVALILMLLYKALASAARQPARARVPIFAYAGATWTVGMLSFGAWQAWWLSAVWLGLALLLGLSMEPARAANQYDRALPPPRSAKKDKDASGYGLPRRLLSHWSCAARAGENRRLHSMLLSAAELVDFLTGRLHARMSSPAAKESSVSGRMLPSALLLIAILAFGCGDARAQFNPRKESQSIWGVMDQCTRDAFKQFPDYTAEDKAKREQARRKCLEANNLPAPAPPQPSVSGSGSLPH